jgi:hypothetical protein
MHTSHGYPDNTALIAKDAPGTVSALLLGPMGAGKSTLANLLGGRTLVWRKLPGQVADIDVAAGETVLSATGQSNAQTGVTKAPVFIACDSEKPERRVIDTPGLLDGESDARRKVQHDLKAIVRGVKSIPAVITIFSAQAMFNDRGLLFIKQLQAVASIFKPDDAQVKHNFFIITQLRNAYKWEDISGKLLEFLTAYKEDPLTHQALLHILQAESEGRLFMMKGIRQHDDSRSCVYLPSNKDLLEPPERLKSALLSAINWDHTIPESAFDFYHDPTDRADPAFIAKQNLFRLSQESLSSLEDEASDGRLVILMTQLFQLIKRYASEFYHSERVDDPAFSHELNAVFEGLVMGLNGIDSSHLAMTVRMFTQFKLAIEQLLCLRQSLIGAYHSHISLKVMIRACARTILTLQRWVTCFQDRVTLDIVRSARIRLAEEKAVEAAIVARLAEARTEADTLLEVRARVMTSMQSFEAERKEAIVAQQEIIKAAESELLRSKSIILAHPGPKPHVSDEPSIPFRYAEFAGKSFEGVSALYPIAYRAPAPADLFGPEPPPPGAEPSLVKPRLQVGHLAEKLALCFIRSGDTLAIDEIRRSLRRDMKVQLFAFAKEGLAESTSHPVKDFKAWLAHLSSLATEAETVVDGRLG